jgi:hypothetical protein
MQGKTPPAFDASAHSAILPVSGFNGLGLATLMAIPRLFKDQFRNVVFVTVGEIGFPPLAVGDNS